MRKAMKALTLSLTISFLLPLTTLQGLQAGSLLHSSPFSRRFSLGKGKISAYKEILNVQ